MAITITYDYDNDYDNDSNGIRCIKGALTISGEQPGKPRSVHAIALEGKLQQLDNRVYVFKNQYTFVPLVARFLIWKYPETRTHFSKKDKWR